MRKSFTRFLSVFMLFCAFGLQATIAAESWDGTKSIPKNTDVNVKPGDIATQFVLAFSATPAVTATGGTLVVYKGATIVKLVPITQSSADVSVVGKTLVVKHGVSSFTEGTAYSIVLTAGAVKAGADAVEIAASTYNFTIGDFTAPKLVVAPATPLVPADGAVGVKANLAYPGGPTLPFTLTMNFDENIALGSGDIAVYNANGTVMDIIRVGDVGAPVVVAGAVATITLNNSSYFAAQTDYFVKVDQGAFTDVSVNLNKYLGVTNNTAWNFSTRDQSSPVITASVGTVTATTANLTVTLSEAGKVSYLVQLASVADPVDATGFTSSVAAAASTAKVFPLTGLTGGSDYEVFVIAENNETPPNVSGAPYKKLTFSTTDDTGPVASSRGLITTSKKSSGAYYYFNEQVVGGTGLLSVRLASDNTLKYSVPASEVSSTKITDELDANFGKWKAVVNFGGNLASNTAYFIVFPAGYMKDLSGNAYGDDVPGISVPVNYNDWNVTSADFEAPVVTFKTTTVTTASNTITGAGLSDNILINFDEAVVLADGSAWPTDFAGWSKYVVFQKDGINVDAAYSYAAGVLTIDPTAPLTSKTTYTVALRANAVKDVSSNPANNNVLTVAQNATVTTGDLDVLHATFGPVANLVATTPLTITFNKDVRAIKATTPFYEALTSANVKATLLLQKTESPGAVTTVDPADYSATYDAATRKITVSPLTGKDWKTSSATLLVNYTLSILPNLIEDNGGIDVEDAAAAVTSNNWPVNDYKKPVATLVASEILIGTPLTVTFDEGVTIVPSASVETQFALKMVDAQGNNVSFTTAWVGNVVTLTPSPALALGKTYYYGVGASMADAAGNVNVAAYKSFKIVGVVVPPTVEALTYNIGTGAATAVADTYSGVEVNSDGKIVVKVNFNTAIRPKNLTLPVTTTLASGITLTTANISGQVVTITITPSPAIGVNDPAASHTVTLPLGLIEANAASGDGSFAPMSGNVVINIKTKDNLHPTFTAVPTGTGIAMDAAVKLTFSEIVSPVAGKTITFKTGANVEEAVSITSANVVKDATVTDGTVWVVKHADFVKFGTAYDVVVGKDAFVDVAANNLGAADVTFSFTTIPNPAPTISSLSPKDEADLVGLAIDMNIVFNEPVVQASVSGSRKLVYVIEKKGSADATINGSGDLVLGGDDVQKYFAYVDETTKVVVDGKTVTIKGVVLEAGKEYYVLITPGAFKDVSLGLPAGQPFAGITSYGATSADPWNFTTSDVYAPEVALSFTKLGADGFATTDSDIKLTFSKKIVKNGGATISNSDLSALPTPLIKLEKSDGDGGWINIKFTGTITNENVITIDNSSLVLLGELKAGTKYRVSYGTPVLEGKDSHTDLGAYSKEFWTTDATAPTAPVVTYKTGSEVNDVSWNSTDGHVINLNVAVADANSGVTDHTAIKVYYLKSTENATLSGSDVKALAQDTKSLTTNGNFDVTYKGNMASKTTYYVYVVSEDVAGNLSAVTKTAVTTDDVEKPIRTGNLPTAFNAAGTVSIVFNEAVKPAGVAKARVIDNATGIVYLVNLANLTTGTDANLKATTIVVGPFVRTDVASYTIEIDPAMIVDVPRQVGSPLADVNAANSWDGIVGTSFVVTSLDQTKPTLLTAVPTGLVDIHPTFILTFSEAVNLNNSFVQYVIYENAPTLKTKSASIVGPALGTPYDIINTANISGGGTAVITLSTNRALVSGHSYYLVVKDLTFSDLSSNVWTNGSDVTLSFTAKDVVPLASTFKADATSLPAAAALVTVPTTLTITLDGPYYLTSALDPLINTFDLQQHVYLNQAGTPVSFSAAVVGNTIVLSGLNGTGLGSSAKGKTYTFGFVNLYDVNKNVNTGAEVSFSVAADAAVNQPITFIPGDNDNSILTKVNIPVDQTFKVQFDGLLYTYNVSYPLNNLLMTVAYLQTKAVFTMNGVTNLDVTALEVVGGKHVVTLKPRVALDSEVTYTLTMHGSWAAGAEGIQIGQGTTAIADRTETFLTADVKAPKLVADVDGNTLPSAYRPQKAGVVGKDQMLSLVFDEKVKGAGIVSIHRWDGVEMATVDITAVTSTLLVAPDPNAGKWILNIGTSAQIMASNPLFVTNVDYYIVVAAGVVTDVAATPNAFAGITTVNQWKITLMDDSTPQVVFVDDTKTGIAVNTKIKLTFDRPVEMGTGWLALYYSDGKAVDLVRTTAGATAMSSYDFTLNRVLAPDTKFYVELGAGTFDLAVDNSIKQEQKSIGGWYFSTEVNAVPVAQTYVPAKADPMTTGVALTSGLSITFDQNVIAGTGSISLHRKQNVGGPIITNFDVTDPTKVSFVGNTLTIAGNVLNLQNNSEYYVIIPGTAVKNTSSTPEFWGGITVPFVWQFSTLNDVVAPTAVYAPKTIGLKPAEVKLTMTFNEPVVAGTGALVIHNAANDAVVETIAITQAMLAGQVVTVTPTTLVESMNYYVQVAAGAIKDLAGNNFAGIVNKTDWTFATGDFTAPTVLSVSPKGTIADNHPTFVVTFNGPVVFGTAGNLKVYKVGSTTATLTIPVTAGMVSGSAVTVTYPSNNALVGGLDKNTSYYVLVDAGLAKDASGNVAPGVSDPTAWTFKTGASFKTVIDPNVSLEFKVYPNPFVEYVDFNASFVVSKVVVTNIAGQTVKQVINPDQRIQLNELRSGVYFMSVYDTDNTVKNTAKIVKR